MIPMEGKRLLSRPPIIQINMTLNQFKSTIQALGSTNNGYNCVVLALKNPLWACYFRVVFRASCENVRQSRGPLEGGQAPANRVRHITLCLHQGLTYSTPLSALPSTTRQTRGAIVRYAQRTSSNMTSCFKSI